MSPHNAHLKDNPATYTGELYKLPLITVVSSIMYPPVNDVINYRSR